jgi:hypothetical protein
MFGKKLVKNSATVGAIGALVVVGGGLGVATAANGGSFILGGSNSATHTTTLKDTSNIPLSIVAKKGKAPLSVNSKGQVKNLNASELGGLTAAGLSTGSAIQLKADVFSSTAQAVGLLPAVTSGTTESLQPTSVLATARLAAGTYLVTATATAEEAICWAGLTSATGAQNYAIAVELSASATGAIRVKKGQRIHEYCAGIETSSPGGEVLTAGLTAIRVQGFAQGTHAIPHLPATLIKKKSALFKK